MLMPHQCVVLFVRHDPDDPAIQPFFNCTTTSKVKRVIRVTRPSLFYPADPTFFSFTKRKKIPVGQNGGFRVMLPAGVHDPDNTRLIATFSEEYSLADVFREIHKLACLCQFSADSKN
jgi:hypothetical protein